MKKTVVELLLLLFLSVTNSREFNLNNLPDEVIEHFKNFGLLTSLNIDQDSVEVVPAVSGQSYGSETTTNAPSTTINPIIEGSTLPSSNSSTSFPVPYVEEVTIQPARTNGFQEQYHSPTHLAVPEGTQNLGQPVYIRVLQPVPVAVPQPYPVEVRIPTPVYVRVPEGYPIGIQHPFGVDLGGTVGGSSFSGIPHGQGLNGLLNSYVASSNGGVHRNRFNPYQTIEYRKTWQ